MENKKDNQVVALDKKRALIAIGTTKKEVKLNALLEEAKEITEVNDDASYQQARSLRLRIRTDRVAVQKAGEAARKDAVTFSKLVISEENRLVNIVDKDEKRLKSLELAYESKVKKEKDAKIEAERQRVVAIESKIDSLKVVAEFGDTSTEIKSKLDRIESIIVDESYQELKEQALYVKNFSLENLEKSLAQAIEQEEFAALAKAKAEKLAEEERAKKDAERIEQDRLEKIAAEENKRLADELEREKKIAKQKADEQAEIDRVERARLAKIAADEKAILDAEIKKANEEKAVAEKELADARKAERRRVEKENSDRAKKELAEKQRKQEEEDKARRAETAPDVDKLMVYIESIGAIDVPAGSSKHSSEALNRVYDLVGNLLEDLRSVCDELRGKK